MSGPKPKLYECNGRSQTLKQWCAELRLSHACLTSRIRYGIPFDRELHHHPIRKPLEPQARLDAALSNWLRSPIGVIKRAFTTPIKMQPWRNAA